jgi:hypothetical protein
VNPSMLSEAAQIMLQLNYYFPSFNESQLFIPDPARNWMAEVIQNSLFSRTPLKISTKPANDIYKKSKFDSDFLEERYFDGRNYFNEYYNTLQTTDFDDTLSIYRFNSEELKVMTKG